MSDETNFRRVIEFANTKCCLIDCDYIKPEGSSKANCKLYNNELPSAGGYDYFNWFYKRCSECIKDDTTNIKYHKFAD